MVAVLDKGFVELVDRMGNDSSVVSAARVSLNNDGMSFDEDKDFKLISYLLTNKHTSPFEHVIFKFHVKCPLFVRSQWMRHRTWSFNEVSRRYTSDDIDFYTPNELRRQSPSNRQASTDELITEIFPEESVSKSIAIMSEHAMQSYLWMLDMGVSREQARMILPQNMYTRFYATVDLHNLLHFLELRNSAHAQFEMRQYAVALENLISKYVPFTLKAWRSLHEEAN